nr:uncharacterized protein LOC106025903 [Cavia porcellus]
MAPLYPETEGAGVQGERPGWIFSGQHALTAVWSGSHDERQLRGRGAHSWAQLGLAGSRSPALDAVALRAGVQETVITRAQNRLARDRARCRPVRAPDVRTPDVLGAAGTLAAKCTSLRAHLHCRRGDRSSPRISGCQIQTWRKRSSVYELHTGTPQPPAVTERTVTQCFPHSSSNSESNSSQLRDIQSVTAHEEPHRGPRHCALEFLKADLLLPEISKPLPLSCNFSPPRAMTTLTAIGQHLRFSQDRICVLESKVCDT